MRKFTIYILLTVFLLSGLFFTAHSDGACAQTFANSAEGGSFYGDVKSLFFPDAPTAAFGEEVYLGGYPLGITFDGSGVTVVGLNEFVAEDGSTRCPALDAGLQLYDVVLSVDGKEIVNSVALTELASQSNGKDLSLTYQRGDNVFVTKLTPQKDAMGQYRLGLWTRDSASGIGTLTYVTSDMRFGSLGHPVFDSQGEMVKVSGGGVYSCEINGVVRGERGTAGELKGNFTSGMRIGNVEVNNKYGVFGSIKKLPDAISEKIAVVSPSQVKPGKAVIYSTINGNDRQAFDIEIIKVSHQRSADDKGLVLRVTDETLLQQTGGIVQGMSGSPIVQDGKLVGAVTHVFVNDPTKGYGVFAEWMLAN